MKKRILSNLYKKKLRNYVDKSLKSGFDLDTIKSKLIQSNVPPAVIDDVLNAPKNNNKYLGYIIIALLLSLVIYTVSTEILYNDQNVYNDSSQHVEEINQELSVNFSFVARNYSQNNQLMNAINNYEKAIELRPIIPTNYIRLGWEYLIYNDYNNAKKKFLKADEIINNDEICWNCSTILKKHSCEPEFCNVGGPFTDKFGKSHYLGLAVIYTSEDEFSKAEEMTIKALNYEKNDSLVYNFLAVEYIEKQNYNKAIDLLKLSLEFNPKDFQTLFLLAKIKYLEQDYDFALSYCNNASILDENHPLSNQLFGLIYFQKGDFNKSIMYLEKYRNNNVWPDLVLNGDLTLARIYIGKKEYVKAKEILQSIIDSYYQSPYNYNQRDDTPIEKKTFTETKEILENIKLL